MKLGATVDAPTMEAMVSAAPRIASFWLPTPHGLIGIGHAGELLTVELPDGQGLGEHRIGIILYARDFVDGTGAGMITPFTADEARTLAAGLLRIANRIDPRKPS